MNDPDHPIIAEPWSYRLTGLAFRQGTEEAESFIDLILERGTVIRRLRFFSPQKISIDEGFPYGSGLFIEDIRDHGMEGLGVRVDDFENSGGGIHFYARSVVDLDTL